MNRKSFGSCPLCKQKANRLLFVDGIFKVIRCPKCDYAFLTPRPSDEEVINIYRNNYFKTQIIASGYTDYFSLEEDLIIEAKRKIKLIKKFVKEGVRLLDFGCGPGYFLSVAQESGFKIIGCDISEEAGVLAKKKFNIEIIINPISPEGILKGDFDVITCWDVIEHLSNPQGVIRNFSERQRSGDYLFISTPNIESIDARILGKHWYGFKKLPEHLSFFSPKSISKLLIGNGYKIILIESWGFQRNLDYCCQQVARYNSFISQKLKRLIDLLGIGRLSLYFPFINMMIVGQRI
jgi:2-polyprenyl-3-methyl-5-hydroxy-6-metoxy-1,4-benzoquinol methylase